MLYYYILLLWFNRSKRFFLVLNISINCFQVKLLKAFAETESRLSLNTGLSLLLLAKLFNKVRTLNLAHFTMPQIKAYFLQFNLKICKKNIGLGIAI